MEGDEEKSGFTFTNSILSEKWIGYTFIMTSVSFGNISQLTTELLLEHLNAKLLGFIVDDSVLPVTGRQPLSDDLHKLCTNLEVFECKEHSLLIVQQRAPFIKGRISAFRKKLILWIETSCFSKIVMCAGISSHIRNDSDLQGDPFRFLTSDLDLKQKFKQDFGWTDYNHKKTDDTYTLPGAGIVKSIYEECNKRSLNFTALLIYCVPGYEYDDVVLLVNRLQTLLGLKFNFKTLPSNWQSNTSENIF